MALDQNAWDLEQSLIELVIAQQKFGCNLLEIEFLILVFRGTCYGVLPPFHCIRRIIFFDF